ncbi:MAG: sulfatase [Rikenellaceae bacterium]
MNRRAVTTSLIVAANISVIPSVCAKEGEKTTQSRPNIVYVFADQLRAQALGYAGDKNVISPNIDKLASESVNFSNAVSGMPVSTPYRGIMLTGQFAINNGMFMNDIQLNIEAVSAGKIFKAAGYETGYIGKWHINGNGRSQYIPKENRQGFDYFKALECTHDYLNSAYYDNDDPNIKYWEGYDAIAQTYDAIEYMRERANGETPFALYLSWGGPHDPYQKVPQRYKDMYEGQKIELRDNVPESITKKAKNDILGYYAQITALDDCIGLLQEAIRELGIEENTIFIFTSDHGDMLGSQGLNRKQKPYDESIRVPFLLKYSGVLTPESIQASDIMLNTPDILPTILGLSQIETPDVLDGFNYSSVIRGEAKNKRHSALIECITPFGEFRRSNGGREYRGVRTERYTYVKDLNGPWLLFDNFEDPYQMKNLVNDPKYKKIQKSLERELAKHLAERNDEFLAGEEYIKRWGYKVNAGGTVDYF